MSASHPDVLWSLERWTRHNADHSTVTPFPSAPRWTRAGNAALRFQCADDTGAKNTSARSALTGQSGSRTEARSSGAAGMPRAAVRRREERPRFAGVLRGERGSRSSFGCRGAKGLNFPGCGSSHPCLGRRGGGHAPCRCPLVRELASPGQFTPHDGFVLLHLQASEGCAMLVAVMISFVAS